MHTIFCWLFQSYWIKFSINSSNTNQFCSYERPRILFRCISRSNDPIEVQEVLMNLRNLKKEMEDWSVMDNSLKSTEDFGSTITRGQMNFIGYYLLVFYYAFIRIWSISFRLRRYFDTFCVSSLSSHIICNYF